ncbi:hypothetical protein ON010_g12999 [Phytophthora cinnamomi]|nr:hypothetical protein ON010_g12999 [Phytophthora cinnamomi]
MRFCFIVLVAVAALARMHDVSAAASTVTEGNRAQTVRALASTERSGEENARGLRVDKTAEKKEDASDEERGLFDYIVGKLEAKKQYREWYSLGLKPGTVTQMLRKREAQGREVDWVVAKGYPDYYRRRKHITKLPRLPVPSASTPIAPSTLATQPVMPLVSQQLARAKRGHAASQLYLNQATSAGATSPAWQRAVPRRHHPAGDALDTAAGKDARRKTAARYLQSGNKL